MRVSTRVIFGRKVVEFPRLARHPAQASRTTLITRSKLHCTAVGKRPAAANDFELDASVADGRYDRTLVSRRHFVFSEIEVTLLASLAATARSHLINDNLLKLVHDSSCSCATACLSIPIS